MNALSSNPGHYNVLLLTVARGEVSIGSGSRELGHSTVIAWFESQSNKGDNLFQLVTKMDLRMFLM